MACSTPVVTYQESLPHKEMKFCLIGDSGTGSSRQLSVAQALHNENCDQVFILGDIIYPNGIKNENDPELSKKFFYPYARLSSSGVTIILGNHDYQGSVKAWRKISKTSPWVFHPHSYFLQKFNDTCFIILDSNLYSRPWLLTSAFRQMKWIASIQNDLRECRHKIALAHHPYLSPKGHRPAKGFLKHFYEDKIIGKMDMLITGHDHILADMGESNGTRLLISGAGGRFETRSGLLILKISDDIQYQFKEVK